MMEVVVDCYDEHERAMGWYYYLDGHLQFPFTANCVTRRAISPLHVNDEGKTRHAHDRGCQPTGP